MTQRGKPGLQECYNIFKPTGRSGSVAPLGPRLQTIRKASDSRLGFSALAPSARMVDRTPKPDRRSNYILVENKAQIGAVAESTVGMYGGLQGIAGKVLQGIEGLELPRLEGK